MSQPPAEVPDEHHVARRARLLPEEQTAGSANPEAQAEIILEDSDRRTLEPDATEEESSQTP